MCIIIVITVFNDICDNFIQRQLNIVDDFGRNLVVLGIRVKTIPKVTNFRSIVDYLKREFSCHNGQFRQCRVKRKWSEYLTQHLIN